MTKMTNEEAIAYFKEHNEILVIGAKDENVYDYEKKEIEAVCMREAFEANEKAIQALEQQPSEECINREAVDILVDELARVISDERCCMSKGRSTATIMQDILDLPPVTPSRPKGKWILIHPLQEDDDGAYICSNCEHGDWDCDTSYKYCPFCGADMQESEE